MKARLFFSASTLLTALVLSAKGQSEYGGDGSSEEINLNLDLAGTDGKDAETVLSADDFQAAANWEPDSDSDADADRLLSNPDMFEGDIAGFDQESFMQFLQDDNRFFDTSRLRPDNIDGWKNAIRGRNHIWRKGWIPYTISRRYTKEHRKSIAKAMLEIQNKTCIRFAGRYREKEYLKIEPLGACWSWVGKSGHGRPGTPQRVSLATKCLYPYGIAVHELLHAIGFFHEQSRADRDEHVSISWENVVPGQFHNFMSYDLKRINHLGAPYDYNSIMHYGQYAFSKNGNPTVHAKAASANIGQRKALSKYDVEKINKLYGCDVKIKPGIKCFDRFNQCEFLTNLCELRIFRRFSKKNCEKTCKMCK